MVRYSRNLAGTLLEPYYASFFICLFILVCIFGLFVHSSLWIPGKLVNRGIIKEFKFMYIEQ